MKIGKSGEGVPAPIDPSRSGVESRKTEGAKSPSVESTRAGFDRVAEQREKALSSKAAELLKGARSPQAGASAQATPEMFIGEAFQKAFGRNPLASPHAPIGKAAADTARRTPGFDEAVEAGRAAAADPRDTSLVKQFTAKVQEVASSSKGMDIIGTLYNVFKESISEQNADKKYVLQKLKESNSVAEALADRLKELNAELEARSLHPNQEGVLPDPDAGTLPPPRTTAPSNMPTAQLRAEITRLESERETLREARQELVTDFENQNQKAQQLTNMLAAVMKTVNEMHNAVARRLL